MKTPYHTLPPIKQVLLLFFFFKDRSSYRSGLPQTHVSEDDLKLLILSPPPECWDYKQVVRLQVCAIMLRLGRNQNQDSVRAWFLYVAPMDLHSQK